VKFYELFLTWRYLTRRPLSLVAVICLGISVAVLVVAPSIMNGFQTEFHKRIRGTLSDLTFASARPFGLPEDAELEAALGELPHVEAVAPYLENPALDKHLRKIDYCFLRGVEPRKEARASRGERRERAASRSSRGARERGSARSGGAGRSRPDRSASRGGGRSRADRSGSRGGGRRRGGERRGGR